VFSNQKKNLLWLWSIAMRAKGVVVTPPTLVKGPLWQEAQQRYEARVKRQAEDKARRDAKPVPNYICYPDAFKLYDPKTGHWSGGKLPKCRVCEAILQPTENHVCPGFVPKYADHDAAWKDRQTARREAIRESRPMRCITCSVCGEVMDDPDAGQWHYEDHEGKPVREHQGDEDDLSGYEDHDDGDYCEGDEDGYD
jgi:hypothetical protein